MQKNDVLRCGESIVRVLDIRENQVLIVTCPQKSVPLWINQEEIREYQPCKEEEIPSFPPDFEELSPDQRRIAHERYTLIAGILPFIGDERQRCTLIARTSEEKGISKATLRRYLHQYLVYQRVSALAPKQKTPEKALSKDEKNMRWALNKFYFTRRKNSLSMAYTQMLKERYCDAAGNLISGYPSIHQFKYFHKKHKSLQTYYISRDGLKSYQRNHRPLLGDGIQEFAPSIGVGMLDATICDIYLVNEAGNLVGRPILTACVDAYSGLCCGYSLSWEGGVYSLRNLMANVIADKVEWCRKFGIHLQQEDWNCSQIPAVLVTDMGTEYKSENFEQISELGVELINLPPYRPELKGVVEKFFDLIQTSFKAHLKGKVVIEPDFQERGAHDYRKDACLTMKDFEKIIIHCIVYYNSKRIIEDFPYTGQMLAEKVQPYASEIWNYGMKQAGTNLISCSYEALMLTLMPRTLGKFGRNGLKVNKLRYRNDDYAEMFLKGGTATVAYNPDDVSAVWLLDQGKYVCFELIEGRFKGMELSNVNSVKEAQRNMEKVLSGANIQAKIDLAAHIETIAHSVSSSDRANIKGIRTTRRKEQGRAYIDHMRGGMKHGQID